MLEVKDVNQFYGGSHILRDVSFQALWESAPWCWGGMA
jgi:ABC-type branched-subunit amino acid transport system ATPase component